MRPRPRSPRGFTLIELVAVTAIIVIVTLVLLLRQSKFDSSTILRSLAYSVALSVRQAQVYGTSVLGTASGGTVNYASAYGLYFTSGSPSSYILFADLNNNGAYDPATETVKIFSLNAGYTISDACAELSNGQSRCTGAYDSSGSHTTNTVTILFKRPDPDAVFATDVGLENYVSAYIQVESADGTTRSVLVTSAGQISVQAPGALPSGAGGGSSSPPVCAPANQTVQGTAFASFTASGGNGTYAWSEPGSAYQQGSGASRQDIYTSPGTYNVTVSSNGAVSNTCVVQDN